MKKQRGTVRLLETGEIVEVCYRKSTLFGQASSDDGIYYFKGNGVRFAPEGEYEEMIDYERLFLLWNDRYKTIKQ